MKLGQSIRNYSAALTVLEETQPHPSAKQILSVLKARDAVQSVLSDNSEDSPEDIGAVLELDRRLKLQAERIAPTVELAEWRASFQPSEKAWWWFLEAPPGKWDRFDWLWTLLTVMCLVISISLVIDITSRFLAGGPDLWAILALVGQSVPTLFAAGGTLTVKGQEALKRRLVRLNIPAQFWHEAQFALVLLLLGGLAILRLSLPGIALGYNNRGVQNYRAGQLISAQSDYLHAIRLEPDYVEAHYNLGVLYEDLQQVDEARTEYLVAVQGGLDAAHNNLARLNILEGNYSAAVPLLKKGLLLTQDDEVRYDLYKNLGWARLGQARYEEASVELQAAIALAPDKAPAHCLYAQVLENEVGQTGAQGEWEMCLKLADPLRPDEDNWIGMARQHVTGRDE